MIIKNIAKKLTMIVVATVILVTTVFLSTGNINSYSAIQNEKQIEDLIANCTTTYENGRTERAFEKMSSGLQTAFNEGTITQGDVEAAFSAMQVDSGCAQLLTAYLPIAQANGYVSSSFTINTSLNSNINETTQTSEQTSSTPSNTTEVAQNESSESTDKDTGEVSVAESSIDTTETSKATDEDENSDADNEWVESERVESTCTEAGYVVYTNASGEEKTEDLPLAEHQYTETSRTAATCTETGSINYTCEVCGDTYSEEIPTIDHLLEEETVEAGLFTSGSKITKCSICGEVISEETIPAKCPKWVVIITIIAIVGIVGAIAFAVKKNVKIGADM